MSRRPRPLRRFRGRSLLRIKLLGGAFAGVLAIAILAGLACYRAPGPAVSSTTVIMERGSSLNQIARTLEDSGVVGSATLFAVATRVAGAEGDLKAGEYAFDARASMARVLADILSGKVVRHMITIPEGWTSEMAAEAINSQPLLTGHADPPPEGGLLPDTYQVERGADRAQVMARMVDAHDALVEWLWESRQPGLLLKTPQEAVILASIVERETGVESERPRIAAVFYNRLRIGMRLESDPTVIYGITKGRPLGHGLRVSELTRRTAYNTYQIDGLPPTPIANPGRAALEVVLNPPRTAELFFVTDGKGGHVFSETYAQHRANVAAWHRLERAQARAGR